MDFQKLVHRKAEPATQGAHPTGEYVPEPRESRQSCCDCAAIGKKRIQHSPHPAARTNPHRLVRASPLDGSTVSLQIQSPMAIGSCLRRRATAADAQRSLLRPLTDQIGQLLRVRLNQSQKLRIGSLWIPKRATV